MMQELFDTGKSVPWYQSWFDAPFYHLLYRERDENEAQKVIDKLLGTLDLAPGSRILDLACGKGRHAKYLSKLGFEVTGLDFSPSSIEFAKQFESETLSFFQHDMRLPFRINYYDAILNMFTSFGYFEKDRDHLRTLKWVAAGLKPGGKFLMDYLNAAYVRANLIEREEVERSGIHFAIERKVDERFVTKRVHFEAEGREWNFEERVRLYTASDFEQLFEAAGLLLQAVFGNYQLDVAPTHQADRLIMICQKPRQHP
jgi:SAM-dependent methyltransferase